RQSRACHPVVTTGSEGWGGLQGRWTGRSSDRPRRALALCVPTARGEVTREGLWLNSAGTGAANDPFQVVAADVRRLPPTPNSKLQTRSEVQNLLPTTTDTGPLPRTGSVELVGNVARFIRPGV